MAATEKGLIIPVVADDKTAKGLDSAKKNVTAFEKTIKNLGKTLGIALSAQTIGRFARDSVQAFLQDEAAATKLGVAVKNLGYEFAQPYIKDYIANLEQTSKVADDELRPAFQALLQQTGSLTDAQSILNTAIETSRGSGEALATVANDLAQAYVGNTKGLKKYYLGIDQATLKTMSFVDIQKQLNQQFSGANEAYLNTYAGQVGALGLAWQNFQEQAGGALLMLASLGEGSNAQGLNNVAKALQIMGNAVTTIAKGATSVLALLNVFGKNKGILGLFNPYGTTNPLENLAKDNKGGSQDFLTKYKDMLSKVATANKKILKQQQDAAKRQAATDKKNALLKKQGTLFDIEQIQLIAALKGKLSEEDRNRVLLQLAILQGNEEAAAKLSAKIADSIDQTGRLKEMINSVEPAKDPFKQWQDTLNGILSTMKEINGIAAGQLNPIPNAETLGYPNPALSGAESIRQYGQQGGLSAGVVAGVNPTVVVQIDGKTIATAMQDQSLSGNQTTVYRGGGGSFQFS